MVEFTGLMADQKKLATRIQEMDKLIGKLTASVARIEAAVDEMEVKRGPGRPRKDAA